MSKLIPLVTFKGETTLAVDPNEIVCVGRDGDSDKTFLILSNGSKLYVTYGSVDELMKTINSYRE